MDESALLDDTGRRQYQAPIGTLNWVVQLGRFDVAYATSLLARFAASPRKGHLERALRVMGYLKRRPNRRIRIDARDPVVMGFPEDELDADELHQKFLREYPDAFEELDPNLPPAVYDELPISIFVDSDHAHDLVTRRSITGVLIFVGRTPVHVISKRQGAVETSTYGAEFAEMKTAVEEAKAMRYMLRCLGVKVEHSTRVYGDNAGVILNSTIPSSLLKKKHVALSYHMTREAVASGICTPIKIAGSNNFSDTMTKAQTFADFSYLTNGVFYG